MAIPFVDAGMIGGSTTWGSRFPEDFTQIKIEVLDYLGEIDTPYGESAPAKLLGYKNHRMIYFGMHGSFPGNNQYIHPYWSSKQMAWIFDQARVKWVLGGGSVGGIQTFTGARLPRWSVVIPDDFMMDPYTLVIPEGRIKMDGLQSMFYRMAKPFDPILSKVLYDEAVKLNENGLFPIVQLRGIYVCTPLGRFETKAEIRRQALSGGSVVGQTIGHEAGELRKIGVPFAVMNIVANDAEGDNWTNDTPDGMEKFYEACSLPMAEVYGSTIRRIFDEGIQPMSLAEFALTGLEKYPIVGA